MSELPKFIVYCRNYLERNKKNDPKFSLNKFSKKVGLNSGILHGILYGERKLTVALARKIGKAMGLDGTQVRELCLDIIYNTFDQKEDAQSDKLSLFTIAASRWIQDQKSSFCIEDLMLVLGASKNETLIIIETLISKEMIERKGTNEFVFLNQPKSLVWMLSESAKAQLFKELVEHALFQYMNCEKGDVCHNNIAFTASSRSIDDNRLLINSIMNDLAQKLSHDSEPGDQRQIYFLFSQVVPAKKANRKKTTSKP